MAGMNEETPTEDAGAAAAPKILTVVESIDLPEGSGYCDSTNDEPPSYFDRVVGILEEILVGEEFQGLQKYYLSKYWASFGHRENIDGNDNTFEHFQIFKDYSQEMSTFLELRLKTTVPTFNIEDFIRQELGPRLEAAKVEEAQSHLIDNEIFEMLFTLVDFLKFKELLIDYGKAMQGTTPNLSVGQQSLPDEVDE